MNQIRIVHPHNVVDFFLRRAIRLTATRIKDAVRRQLHFGNLTGLQLFEKLAIGYLRSPNNQGLKHKLLEKPGKQNRHNQVNRRKSNFFALLFVHFPTNLREPYAFRFV